MGFTLLQIDGVSNLKRSAFSFKFASTLFFFCLSLFSVSANSQENGSMPYSKVNNMLTIIKDYAKSPYTGLVATIKPEIKEIKLAGIQLTIVHENQTIKRLVVGDKGTVDFPLLPSDIGEEATLEINKPKGSISLELNVGIKPISEHRVSYKDVIGVLDDIDIVISELTSIPSWLVPDIDYIEFVFDSPASIILQDKKNKKTYVTTSDLKIQLERDDDFQSSDAELVFSALPKNVNVVK